MCVRAKNVWGKMKNLDKVLFCMEKAGMAQDNSSYDKMIYNRWMKIIESPLWKTLNENTNIDNTPDR